jgi:2-polyprenyl-3-methyl-5-hydroxy-6-metoxy-1,4-benzoquinol methylase
LERLGDETPGRNVLDDGCGKGDFVAAAMQAGWHPVGIDLSPEAIAVARQFGLPASNTDFLSREIETGSFDLVTLFEVIEHVDDPGSFLARAAEVVKPGGLVYLTTPNFASLDRRILGGEWHAIHREHVTYFTPGTLAQLAERTSPLKLCKLETKNLSDSLVRKFDPRNWLTRGAHPMKSPIDGPSPGDAGNLRTKIESSFLLRATRDTLNAGLSATRLGESMVALFRRPLERA